MSIHGQSNLDIRRSQPFSSEPKENVQGSHGKVPDMRYCRYPRLTSDRQPGIAAAIESVLSSICNLSLLGYRILYVIRK